MLSYLARMSGEFMSKATVPLVVEVVEREGVSTSRPMSDKSTQLLKNDRTNLLSPPHTTTVTTTSTTTSSVLESETERAKKYAAAQIMSELAAGLYIQREKSNTNNGSQPGASTSGNGQVNSECQNDTTGPTQSDGKKKVIQRPPKAAGNSDELHRQEIQRLIGPDQFSVINYPRGSSTNLGQVHGMKQLISNGSHSESHHHHMAKQESNSSRPHVASQSGTRVEGGRDFRSSYHGGSAAPGNIETIAGSHNMVHKLSASYRGSVGYGGAGRQHERGESPSAAPQSGPVAVVTYLNQSPVGEQSVIYTHGHHHSFRHHSPNHQQQATYATRLAHVDIQYKQNEHNSKCSSPHPPIHKHIYQKTGSVIKTSTCDVSLTAQDLPTSERTAPVVSHSNSCIDVAPGQVCTPSSAPLTLLPTRTGDMNLSPKLSNSENEKISSLPLKKRKYVSTKTEEAISPRESCRKREVKYPRVDGDEQNNNKLLVQPVKLQTFHPNVANDAVNKSSIHEVRKVSAVMQGTSQPVKTETSSTVSVSSISQVVRVMSAVRQLQGESETKDYDNRLRKMAQMARASTSLASTPNPSPKHVLQPGKVVQVPSPLVSPSHFPPARLPLRPQTHCQSLGQQNVPSAQHTHVGNHMRLLEKVVPKPLGSPEREPPRPIGEYVHQQSSGLTVNASSCNTTPPQQLNGLMHHAPAGPSRHSNLHMSPREVVGRVAPSVPRGLHSHPVGHCLSYQLLSESPIERHVHRTPDQDSFQRQPLPLDLSKPKFKVEPEETSTEKARKEKWEAKNEESRSAAAPECVPMEGGAAEPLKKVKRKRNADKMPISTKQNLVLLHECLQAVKPDEDGDLPLHIAVVQGYMGATEKLVMLMESANVTIDTKNALRQTPLHLAVITCQPHLVEFLLTKGASPDTTDRHGNTCVHLAVEHKTTECLAVLVDRKIKPQLDRKNYEGLTPLHQAVLLDDRHLVAGLIQAGASIDVTDGKSGRTPLHYATEALNTRLVEQLLQLGAKVNVQSYAGNTALHTASERNFKDLMTLLVKYGADPTIKNANHETYTNMTKDTKMANIKREIVPPKSLQLTLQVGASRKSGRAARQSPRPRCDERPDSPALTISPMSGSVLPSPLTPSPRPSSLPAGGKLLSDRSLSPHLPPATRSPVPLSPLVTGRESHASTGLEAESPPVQTQPPSVEVETSIIEPVIVTPRPIIISPALHTQPTDTSLYDSGRGRHRLPVASQETILPHQLDQTSRIQPPRNHFQDDIRAVSLVHNIITPHSLLISQTVPQELKKDPPAVTQAISPFVLQGLIQSGDMSQPLKSQQVSLSPSAPPTQEIVPGRPPLIQNQENQTEAEQQQQLLLVQTTAAQLIRTLVNRRNENSEGSGPIRSLANMVQCLPTFPTAQSMGPCTPTSALSSPRMPSPESVSVNTNVASRTEFESNLGSARENRIRLEGENSQVTVVNSASKPGRVDTVIRNITPGSENEPGVDRRLTIVADQGDEGPRAEGDVQSTVLPLGTEGQDSPATDENIKIPPDPNRSRSVMEIQPIVDNRADIMMHQHAPQHNSSRSGVDGRYKGPRQGGNAEEKVPIGNRPSSDDTNTSGQKIVSEKSGMVNEALTLKQAESKASLRLEKEGNARLEDREQHSSRLDPYSGTLYEDEDEPSSPDLSAPLVICEDVANLVDKTGLHKVHQQIKNQTCLPSSIPEIPQVPSDSKSCYETLKRSQNMNISSNQQLTGPVGELDAQGGKTEAVGPPSKAHQRSPELFPDTETCYGTSVKQIVSKKTGLSALDIPDQDAPPPPVDRENTESMKPPGQEERNSPRQQEEKHLLDSAESRGAPPNENKTEQAVLVPSTLPQEDEIGGLKPQLDETDSSKHDKNKKNTVTECTRPIGNRNEGPSAASLSGPYTLISSTQDQEVSDDSVTSTRLSSQADRKESIAIQVTQTNTKDSPIERTTSDNFNNKETSDAAENLKPESSNFGVSSLPKTVAKYLL